MMLLETTGRQATILEDRLINLLRETITIARQVAQEHGDCDCPICTDDLKALVYNADTSLGILESQLLPCRDARKSKPRKKAMALAV